MNEYNFKISNFPDNLDLSEIPIEIFYENSEVKLIEISQVTSRTNTSLKKLITVTDHI